MKRLRAWMIRLGGIFTEWAPRKSFGRARSHLQLHIDDNLRDGMTPEQARGKPRSSWEEWNRPVRPIASKALFRFGELPSGRSFRDPPADRNPGFTVIAILMLSLGMAASVSIFSFVDATLIKPLPYYQPNRLVDVNESITHFLVPNLSYPDYLDWKRMNQVFSSSGYVRWSRIYA